MRGMRNVAHAELKAEIKSLRAMLSEGQSALAERDSIIVARDRRLCYLLEHIRLQRYRLCGASSEQAPGQGLLFDEADVLAATATDTATTEPAADGAPEANASPRQALPPSCPPAPH